MEPLSYVTCLDCALSVPGNSDAFWKGYLFYDKRKFVLLKETESPEADWFCIECFNKRSYWIMLQIARLKDGKILEVTKDMEEFIMQNV